MTELENGLYRINVSSIVVGPGDTSVKLNMTITKAGYTSLYYEKIVLFYDDDDGNLLNQVLDWITTPTGMIIVIGSLLGLVVLIVILIKRRK